MAFDPVLRSSVTVQPITMRARATTAVVFCLVAATACTQARGAPTGPSPPPLFQIISPGPSDTVPSQQAGFKGFIEAAPRCRLGPPPPCGAADYPVSADVTFMLSGSRSVYQTHAEPGRVFTIELPPGRYVVRIAHVVAPSVPGLRVNCPQGKAATAKAGVYVTLSITCAYPT
jgi:hypothetical protein